MIHSELPPPAPQDTVNPEAGFWRSEDGSLVIFSLFAFVVMASMLGLAVDLMRFEQHRNNLQNTIDRAAMASASLHHGETPLDVATDFLDANGQLEFLDGVDVGDGIGTRAVTVRATARLESPFFNLLGRQAFESQLRASASEAAGQLEVSLVLDVSTSMAGAKIIEMQDAAKLFVTHLLANAGEGDVVVNVIPYGTQVALPRELADELNFDRFHDYSSCVNFEGSDFSQTAIHPVNDELEQTQHFDAWYNWGPTQSSYNSSFVCRADAAAQLHPNGTSVSALHTMIDNLTADGNTSIDLGLKWGAAMLDPAMRPVMVNLASQGHISPLSADRPADYGESTKVVVLMTDGHNTTQYMLADSLRDQLSNVYRDTSGDIWIKGDEARNSWRNTDGSDREHWFSSKRYYYGWSNWWRDSRDFPNSGHMSDGQVPVGFEQLSWADVFDFASLRYNAYRHQYAQNWLASDYYEHHDWSITAIDGATKNARLLTMCNAVKAQDVVIYAVGFEVTDSDAILMEECASSPSHFYRVFSPGLAETFDSIGKNLTVLRMVN